MNVKESDLRLLFVFGSLAAIGALSSSGCSFDDRDVRERPGIDPGDGDGDVVGDGDGDVVGDGDGDVVGDGDVDDELILEFACEYALTALSSLFTNCLGQTFTYADCSGADATDSDALITCGDEAYASNCDTLTAQSPSQTPVCDVLVDDSTIYLEFAP